MKTSEIGLQLIRRFEGFAPRPYRCPAGYWTVGYGHVLAVHEPHETISPSQAEALLTRDVRHAELSVMALIPIPLTQNRFDALVSFTFNLGSAALERSTLRQVIHRGEHEEVPRQLMRWVYAKGRKLPGLLRRRMAEGALYSGV